MKHSKLAAIIKNRSKSRKFFDAAYEQAFGVKWNWLKDDGTLRHPVNEGTLADKYFYLGFRAGKVTQKEYKEMAEEIASLQKRIDELRERFI